MKKYFFLLLSVAIGCHSPTEKKSDLKYQVNIKNYNTVSGHPDTSLAVFLYNNKDDYNFEKNFFEYQRFELEKVKIIKLIDT